MKVITLAGTYTVDLDEMKIVRPDGTERTLDRVPSPIIGERMQLEDESTAQVKEVQP